MEQEEFKTANKAGAGNGAGTLLFQAGRLGRAVPDLIRSAASSLSCFTPVNNTDRKKL
jgi:hypothetical protein